MSLRSDYKSKIFSLISENPGIHLRELHRALGSSFNSIRYNTEKMASSGQIVCEKNAGFSRFYPAGMSDRDKLVYSFSRNKAAFTILRELSGSLQLSNKELSTRTGLAKSTVSERVHELLAASLVKLTLSDEGSFKIELQDRDRIRGIIEAISSSQTRRQGIVQNYVDLWDF